MITLQGTNSSWWWIFVIAGIFIVIGIIVFVLRKKIPGLADYEKEDEEKIAQDNLARILVDVEPEKKEDKDKEDNAENK